MLLLALGLLRPHAVLTAAEPPQYAARRLVPAVRMSATSALERAPPKPPPMDGGGGGGGGDGNGGGEYLQLLDSLEMSFVISDWIARARIYKRSDTIGITERQVGCINVLEHMDLHRTLLQPGAKRLSIGLFDDDRIWALSTIDVSVSNGLTVHWLMVNPQELNKEDSTAALRLLHGLHVLAEKIELPLDLKPLRENHFLQGVGLLTADTMRALDDLT